MLRAKAKRFRDDGATWSDRVLSNTDQVGKLAGISVVVEVVNAVNRSAPGRALLERTLGVDRTAPIPVYHSRTAHDRLSDLPDLALTPTPAGGTRGKVVLFTSCYGDRNVPAVCEDLAAVYRHNGIQVAVTRTERCCGMPKLELGDLESVAAARDANLPELLHWVRDGWDIVAPVPSCVLMFKQELPLLFPDDEAVRAVAAAFYDPFDYLHRRHKAHQLNTDFTTSLGKVIYQVPCHLRVQNIGMKTKSMLELVPDTEVTVIERCSGHDGTYGIKKRFRAASLKIAAPVVRRVEQSGADYFTSDCPMAGEQIALGLDGVSATHPLSLLRKAYGI
jgi:Fe-S oxidoreductase